MSDSYNPAVLIPLYKSELSSSEIFSLEQGLKILASHDLIIIGPERLKWFYEELRKKYSSISGYVLFKDHFFASIHGYNRLLMLRSFYERFSDYTHILIYQTDALVFEDRLLYWCAKEYSYIGAPWLDGYDKPVHPFAFIGVGNGGLSLRKVDDFINALSVKRFVPNILNTHKSGSGDTLLSEVMGLVNRYILAYNFYPFLPRVNEDAFWGILIPEVCDFFKVPGPQMAVSFAFEVEPRFMFEVNNMQIPFGCHAWERYDKMFWVDILNKQGVELP